MLIVLLSRLQCKNPFQSNAKIKFKTMSSKLDIEKLKTIDKDVQFTVFGFIRNAQKLFPSSDNPYYTIPELVVYISLKFYYEGAIWDLFDTDYSLSNHKRTLTRIKCEDQVGWDSTSYVNIEVDSMEKCIAKWYIRIDKSVGNFAMIGFVGGRLTTNKGLFGRDDYVYFGYQGAKQHLPTCKDGWVLYGASFGDNDEICSVLDLKKKEISWHKNGISQGIAFKNIECRHGMKYRLGISFHEKGSSATIDRFEKQY